MTNATSLAGSADFLPAQKSYLEGYFSGLRSSGCSFADLMSGGSGFPATAGGLAVGSTAQAEVNLDDLTKEERIKRALNPFDATEELIHKAKTNTPPEAEDVFRFKWNGLFWLNPTADGYMCRLRIPGGMMKSFQVRELAAIARELTTGYIQITTRNNFQIRLIEPKDCPEVLRRIQSVGLHSRGAGADNIRNITMNPCAGYDPYELIDVRPLVDELSLAIVASRQYYDLPRKFNIAFDGGGLISAVEDTNDIGATAVRLAEGNAAGVPAGVYFRIALGGVTGHQTFASDWGVIVPPEELVSVMLGIVRVFARDGDRTNRKKARLKYLIEARGLDGFRDDVEAHMGKKLTLLAPTDEAHVAREFSQLGHSHVGVYPQKQKDLHYVGATVPVGQMTADQLSAVADLCEKYGTGEIRLTVWQNFIIPNVSAEAIKPLCLELQALGFDTQQSHVKSGFIACTGSRYCKFASADTKGHAIATMNYLDGKITLDQPINVHFTGCAHSCAQHFMGDVGLLATKVKESPSGEGYHITLGGGFGENRRCGRQVFNAVPAEQVGPVLETLFTTYLRDRQDDETFHSYCGRHSIEQLQQALTSVAS
jgi:ferredoxin-nitrite reductase